jgi:hypothetical protein
MPVPKAIIPPWSPNNEVIETQREKPSVKIFNWKKYERNTLKGFFSAMLPSSMVIHKLTLHEKNGAQWIGPPTEKYTKSDNSVVHSKLVEFASREAADRFRDLILSALREQGIVGAQHEEQRS